MSSSVSPTFHDGLPVFQGTDEEAKTLIKSLGKQLQRSDAMGKLVLREVACASGARKLIFHVTRDSLRQNQKKATAAYLSSIIDVAYPSSEDEVSEIEMLKNGFAAYLQPKDRNIETAEVVAYLQELHIAKLSREPLHEPVMPLECSEPEKISGTVDGFLASKNILKGRLLGEGAFGTVSEISVEGNCENYVFKEETNPHYFLKNNAHAHLQFSRRGDCAASRVNIPSIAKTLVIFVFVQKPPHHGEEELYCLPTSKAKLFEKELPNGSQIKIVGQIMERAKGEDLRMLMKRYPADFVPGSRHFDILARGLFKALCEMSPHNLLHGDLKPENVIYNPTTGVVKLVDFGSAQRLRKHHKTSDSEHLNRRTSQDFHGTMKYMAPSILQRSEYSSEVDFFSYGMMLLELINYRDFEKFPAARFGGNNPNPMSCEDLLRHETPENYLSSYLQTISHRCAPTPVFIDRFSKHAKPSSSASLSAQPRNTETSRVLARYPEIREVIDLCFRVSVGGTTGQTALKALSACPYFQEERKISSVERARSEIGQTKN